MCETRTYRDRHKVSVGYSLQKFVVLYKIYIIYY